MPVKLLKHQLNPLEYIISRCKEQKGLIMFHHMGTGKTISGLVFLNNYPNDKKVIILPKNFESIWIHEAINLGLEKLIKEVTFLNYSDLLKFEDHKNLLENSVCVMDEVHNIDDVIGDLFEPPDVKSNEEGKKKRKIEPRLIQFIDVLYSIKKKLMLSGTLIKDFRVNDLSWLINIASSKNNSLVPYDYDEFMLKYGKRSKVGIFYLQAFRPFMKHNPFGILPKDVVEEPLSRDPSDIFDKLYIMAVGGISSVITARLGKFKFPTLNPELNMIDVNRYKEFFSKLNLGGVNKYLDFFSKSVVLNINKYKEIFSNINPVDINTYKNIFSKLKDIDIKNLKKQYNVKNLSISTGNTKGLPNLKNLTFNPVTKLIGGFILSVLITNGLKLLFAYIKAFYEETYNFAKLDVEKLKKDGVGKYFSYFNYIYTESTDYPKIKKITKKVKYTSQQVVLLMKVIGFPENLKNQEYIDLDITDNMRAVELFKNAFSIEVSENYTNKGRIIGNLYEDPVKFTEILKIYKNNSKPQTVVYSNFYKSGIILFSNFLTKNGIAHSIYNSQLKSKQKIQMLKEFKDEKINLLLLAPEYYEGISILGCNHFHILEPVSDSNTKDQLFARVVRYKSHDHLEVSKRNVKIYQWGCTLLYDLNKILYSKEYVSQWVKSNDGYKTIVDLFKNFKEHFSPDDRILNHYAQFENFKKDFSNIIKNISIDQSEIPLECCIWTPDNSCSDAKLKSCRKPYKKYKNELRLKK